MEGTAGPVENFIAKLPVLQILLPKLLNEMKYLIKLLLG